MKIYIPKHLESLEIIKNLRDLIKGYGANPIENSNSSTINKFQDPVKNFISICSNGKLDEVMLGYYSNIFYCVKGTGKVFNYLIELIKLCNEDIEISCTYNMESIKIELSRIPYSNEVIFRDSLMDFLSNLIYFKEFNLTCSDEVYNLLTIEETRNFNLNFNPSLRSYNIIKLKYKEEE